MIPTISQICTLPSSFADDLIGYSEGGCSAIEVWLTKLEKHLETTSAEATRQLLAERNITLPAAAYQGGLLLSQGSARQEAFDLYKKRLNLCEYFSIPTLILVADFSRKIDITDLNRAVVSLKQAAQWASTCKVSLALEFRGGDAFCSCLETALMLVEQADEPNVGVCLDVFHYFKGPSKAEDLERLEADNVLHVQVCDVAGIPRELMADSDRIFPGEGDFVLAPILKRLREIGYDRAVSLEMLNSVVAQSKPSQVAELGLTALQRILR